jgi:hypothetical protein
MMMQWQVRADAAPRCSGISCGQVHHRHSC